MNWDKFFETYCTLSDENNTPYGKHKEYSTKGKSLTIHTKQEYIGLGAVKEDVFEDVVSIEHNIEKWLHKGKSPTHTIVFTYDDGSSENFSMWGDESYMEVDVNVIKKNH